MNFCIENNCSACCIGMVHQKISTTEASFLLKGKQYTFVNRKFDFDGLKERSKVPVVFYNSRKDPIKSESGGKVSLLMPGRCPHLNIFGLCDDYDNRPISCMELKARGVFCLECRTNFSNVS